MPTDFRKIIRRRVLKWYSLNGRSLPWRRTKDPFRILVAEVMLQQTQVHRVLSHYPRFLKRFPTIRTLARAQRRSVIRAWRGLGYNNRAVRLHALARTISREYGGEIPGDINDLVKLPGLGRYTANAIAYTAFAQRTAIVEVNVRRLLSRLLWKMPDQSAVAPEADLWRAAEALLPRRHFFAWNQALMDLGATVCKRLSPLCGACPLATLCISRDHLGRTEPVQRKRKHGLQRAPNRIYRGRVVEILRGIPVRAGLRRRVLGPMIYQRYSRKDAPWLGRILAALERDGLIRLADNRVWLR